MLEAADNLKITSISTLTIIVAILICCIGCEERIVAPGNSGPDANPELIDVWSLVKADHLWEGDIIIDAYGIGVEYGVNGREFCEQKYDFSRIEYSLVDNILSFEDKIYKRNSTDKKRSPNFIFPDEGLVKLFLIDNALPYVVKTGYNSDLDLFYKKISIWSPQFGNEVDTMWYRVLKDRIIEAFNIDYSDSSKTRFGPDIYDPKHFKDWFFEPSLWRTIYDTTVTSKHYSIIYQGPSLLSIYGNPGFSGRDSLSAYNSYLRRFSLRFAHSCLVTDGLGTIYTEWENVVPWGNGRVITCPVYHHVATLRAYYNPLDNYDAGYKVRNQ